MLRRKQRPVSERDDMGAHGLLESVGFCRGTDDEPSKLLDGVRPCGKADERQQAGCNLGRRISIEGFGQCFDLRVVAHLAIILVGQSLIAVVKRFPEQQPQQGRVVPVKIVDTANVLNGVVLTAERDRICQLIESSGDDRIEESVLVAEVAVDAFLVDPCALGDAVDTCPGDAVCGELLTSCGQQKLLGVLGALRHGPTVGDLRTAVQPTIWLTPDYLAD